MKSLLRFVLMISLIIIGKFNTSPTESTASILSEESIWVIPVHSAVLRKMPAAIVPVHQESGKFRSWRLLHTVASPE